MPHHVEGRVVRAPPTLWFHQESSAARFISMDMNGIAIFPNLSKAIMRPMPPRDAISKKVLVRLQVKNLFANATR
jgi:hypothetical protein